VAVIRMIKHRGLKRLYDGKSPKGVDPNHVARLQRVLTTLDVATVPSDMNIPGWGLHPLKGDRKGYWAVSITGNWRLTWRFDGENATDVDYEDYH
jgi:proteic killer suppression protein